MQKWWPHLYPQMIGESIRMSAFTQGILHQCRAFWSGVLSGSKADHLSWESYHHNECPSRQWHSVDNCPPSLPQQDILRGIFQKGNMLEQQYVVSSGITMLHFCCGWLDHRICHPQFHLMTWCIQKVMHSTGDHTMYWLHWHTWSVWNHDVNYLSYFV